MKFKLLNKLAPGKKGATAATQNRAGHKSFKKLAIIVAGGVLAVMTLAGVGGYFYINRDSASADGLRPSDPCFSRTEVATDDNEIRLGGISNLRCGVADNGYTVQVVGSYSSTNKFKTFTVGNTNRPSYLVMKSEYMRELKNPVNNLSFALKIGSLYRFNSFISNPSDPQLQGQGLTYNFNLAIQSTGITSVKTKGNVFYVGNLPCVEYEIIFGNPALPYFLGLCDGRAGGWTNGDFPVLVNYLDTGNTEVQNQYKGDGDAFAFSRPNPRNGNTVEYFGHSQLIVSTTKADGSQFIDTSTSSTPSSTPTTSTPASSTGTTNPGPGLSPSDPCFSRTGVTTVDSEIAVGGVTNLKCGTADFGYTVQVTGNYQGDAYKTFTVGNLNRPNYAILKQNYLNTLKNPSYRNPNLEFALRVTQYFNGSNFDLRINGIDQSKIKRTGNNGTNTFYIGGMPCTEYEIRYGSPELKYSMAYCDGRNSGWTNGDVPVLVNYLNSTNAEVLTQYKTSSGSDFAFSRPNPRNGNTVEYFGHSQLIAATTKPDGTPYIDGGSASSSSSTTTSTPAPTTRVYGAFDFADCNRITGWVADREHVNRRLQIRMDINDVEVYLGGQKFTNVPRIDVTAALKAAGFPDNTGSTINNEFGFDIALPDAAKTPGTKKVSVYAYYRTSDGIVELVKTPFPGNSKTITCAGNPPASSSSSSSSSTGGGTGGVYPGTKYKIGQMINNGTDESYAKEYSTALIGNAYAVPYDSVKNNGKTDQGCEIRTLNPLTFKAGTNCKVVGYTVVRQNNNATNNYYYGRSCVAYHVQINGNNTMFILPVCMDGYEANGSYVIRNANAGMAPTARTRPFALVDGTPLPAGALYMTLGVRS